MLALFLALISRGSISFQGIRLYIYIYSMAYPLALILQLIFARWYAHRESNETHNAESRCHLRSSPLCPLKGIGEDQTSWLESLYQCHISLVQKTISGLPVRIALTSNPLSTSLFSLFFVPSSWLRLLTLRSIHIEKPPEISISIHYLFKVRKNTQKFTYSSYSYPFAEASPLKISRSYISSFSWDFLKTLIASHDGPQKRLPFFSAVLAWTKLRRRLAWLSGLSIHSPHELAMIKPTVGAL